MGLTHQSTVGHFVGPIYDKIFSHCLGEQHPKHRPHLRNSDRQICAKETKVIRSARPIRDANRIQSCPVTLRNSHHFEAATEYLPASTYPDSQISPFHRFF